MTPNKTRNSNWEIMNCECEAMVEEASSKIADIVDKRAGGRRELRDVKLLADIFKPIDAHL